MTATSRQEVEVTQPDGRTPRTGSTDDETRRDLAGTAAPGDRGAAGRHGRNGWPRRRSGASTKRMPARKGSPLSAAAPPDSPAASGGLDRVPHAGGVALRDVAGLHDPLQTRVPHRLLPVPVAVPPMVGGAATAA